MRLWAVISMFVLTVGWALPAAAADPLDLRVDGKVLRKSSGKLVLSLGRFELEGKKVVTLERRKTGERRTLGLSSSYEDFSYSDTLPKEEYDAIDPDEWVPFVVWVIPRTNDEMNRRLTSLHEEQNLLRREMGHALIEEGEAGGKVTSRTTLNKIEKYHRLATRVAREILKGWSKEETNPFFFPVRIQIGFNPFGAPGAVPSNSPQGQIREVMYWELSRILTQQYDVDDNLVGLIYNAPGSARQIVPLVEMTREELSEFVPMITISSETLDGAVYIQTQGFVGELRDALRMREFLGRFILDRPVLDAFVNEGRVIGIVGKQAAVSFIPPFMRPNERMYVALEGGGGPDAEAPVVLGMPLGIEGYTLTADLPDDVLKRVKVGAKVHRK